MKTVEELIAHVLHIDASNITDATSPNDIENWDSFNGLVLVTELEKEFNVSFSLDEVVAVKNVRDIKTSLKKHGVNIA
ncbi:MAG: acyl carrier protein [Patescibacteria group bacterium]|mgnify:FL=1